MLKDEVYKSKVLFLIITKTLTTRLDFWCYIGAHGPPYDFRVRSCSHFTRLKTQDTETEVPLVATYFLVIDNLLSCAVVLSLHGFVSLYSFKFFSFCFLHEN